MNTHKESLQADIQALYPDQKFTENELNDMADRLIKFFAVGAKSLKEQKRREELMKLHNERKSNPVSDVKPG